MDEPSIKRAVAFVDGQNLFHTASALFGCTYPNYNPKSLAHRVCSDNDWTLKSTRFYTGIPDPQKDPVWNRFWSKRLLRMSREGVETFQRPLQYTKQTREFCGQHFEVEVPKEKGIDIRIALDVIRLGLNDEYDVAIIFSQDQDFSEVVDEMKQIATKADRWIKIVSAYPWTPASRNPRGINGAEWVRIDEAMYNNCRDLRDYR